MSAHTDKVQWFYDHLGKQIAFGELESEGTTLETFLDTAEVQAALLGMYDLLRPGGESFNVEKFRKRKMLVHALASAGWLGSLRLLIPHESEFLSNLKRGFLSPAEGLSPRQMAGRFFSQLDISIPLQAKALAEKSLEERKRYVRKHVGSAEKLFKAIHLTAGSWQIRFVSWRQSGRLTFSEGDFDIGRAMQTEHFGTLREALNVMRPSYLMNNLTDALALVELSQRVQAWKSGKSKSVPILFSSSSTLQQALASLPKDLRSRFFSVWTHSGQHISVVQDADYFVFRAIFNPPEEYRLTEIGDDIHISVRESGLKRLQKEVGGLLDAKRSLQRREELRSLWNFKNVQKLIQQMETLPFFENVWLAKAERDIEEVEAEIRESARRLRNKPFQEGVARLLRENLIELTSGTQAYEATIEAAEALRRSLVTLRQIVGEEAAENLDPFLRFGLLRFGLPAEFHAEIRSTVADLLSGTATRERNASTGVLLVFQETHRGASVSEKRLATLAGVFWCLGLDRVLINVLRLARSRRKRRKFQSNSLEVILAAAELRGAHSFGGAWEIIQYLDGRIEEMRRSERRSDLMIGVAYLYFHYLQRAKSLRRRPSKQKENQCRERGIDLALSAVDEASDHSKRMYAINQYLYYAVEAQALARLLSIEKMAKELEDALDQPGWQYRFDDTLARYYWLQASLAQTESSWRRLLDQALKYFEKASANALNDPIVTNGHGLIAIESSKGFQFRRKLSPFGKGSG